MVAGPSPPSPAMRLFVPAAPLPAVHCALMAPAQAWRCNFAIGMPSAVVWQREVPRHKTGRAGLPASRPPEKQRPASARGCYPQQQRGRGAGAGAMSAARAMQTRGQGTLCPCLCLRAQRKSGPNSHMRTAPHEANSTAPVPTLHLMGRAVDCGWSHQACMGSPRIHGVWGPVC